VVGFNAVVGASVGSPELGGFVPTKDGWLVMAALLGAGVLAALLGAGVLTALGGADGLNVGAFVLGAPTSPTGALVAGTTGAAVVTKEGLDSNGEAVFARTVGLAVSKGAKEGCTVVGENVMMPSPGAVVSTSCIN
jgi:hypothetical protein